MKKLLFAAMTLAAFSMLMPQVGQAQHMNQVGIYTDMVGTPSAANYAATPSVPFDVYLVLTNPMNDTYNGGTGTNRPVTIVSGFEAKVIWPASATFFKLSESFPANAIDAASDSDEYAVGYATPVAVVDNAIAVCHWQLMVTTTDPYHIFLDTIRFDSIDGFMAFIDAEDPNDTDWQDGNLAPMHVSTGDKALPVFSINDTATVAVEAETWGGVKSLFR